MTSYDLRVEPRVSLITLVVADLQASRAFYVDGLGWQPEFEAPGEVLMFRVADKVILSLWDRTHAEGELGPVEVRAGLAPLTLAHNVAERDQVDAVLADARAAGASVVHDAQVRAWGGYTGYFADSDGFRWEVAWNPSPLGDSLLP